MKRVARSVASEMVSALSGCGAEVKLKRRTLEKWILKLAPPVNRTHITKRESKYSPSIRRLDDLCREIVFAREGQKCRRCGDRARLQWCHVYSRGLKWIRHDLDNSFCGCAGCHLWWHHHPADAAKWWEKEIGEQRYHALMLRAGKPQRTELILVKIYLGKEWDRIKKALEDAEG